MPFSLRLLILASIVVLPFFANGAMELIENMLTAPKNFHLEFPEGRIPSPLAQKYKIPEKTGVKEVMLVGTFNDWGSKQSLDYLIEGYEGYPLEKVAPHRWETKVQLPPGKYFYKFKFRVHPVESAQGGVRSNIGLFHRVNPKTYPDWLWTEDLSNPEKEDDRFGGFNSVWNVKSIKKFKTIFNLLYWSAVGIFFSRYLIRKFVSKVMLMEIRLASKFLFIISIFILITGTLLFFTFLFAGTKLLRTMDTQIANLLYNAGQQSIVETLRQGKTVPPEPSHPFWLTTRRLMDNQSPESYSLRDVDITWTVLYDHEGKPLLMGASENHTTWLAAHPNEKQKLLQNIFSEKPSFSKVSRDLTYGTFDPNKFELTLNDSNSIFKRGILTANLILKNKKLFPYNSFLYKIKTGRKTYGYILIFSFRNLKSYLLNHLISSTFYSLFIISALALLVVFICVHSLLWPLQNLMRQMLRLESGDFTARVYFKTQDELGQMGEAFNKMVESLKEKEQIKETFGKYVSAEVAKEILKNPNLVKLAGEKREVTVLYADLRNFTPYAEKNSPEQVLATLNDYLSVMIETILNSNGTIDKFIGDCAMAIFGAPLTQTEHAEKACRCALELKVRAQSLSEGRKKRGEVPLEIGIGINSGIVVAGNLGNEKRTEYSVIGDAVNLAYRLKDIAKAGQILLGPATYEKIQAKAKANALPAQIVKGKSEPIQIYELLSFPLSHSRREKLRPREGGEWG